MAANEILKAAERCNKQSHSGQPLQQASLAITYQALTERSAFV
jgi:hypothetical protein